MSSPTPSTRDLAAELRAADVEVDASSRARAEYSSDASLYRIVPQAVAFPRSADDVEAALAVCRSVGVPVTARGGGTSIAGNAVGPGLVLDFSRHMDRVLAVDPESAAAVVQPGVVQSRLQSAAAPHGLRFGPDPSTHNRCTLGGIIGNNACGNRSLGYGRPSDNLVALDLLTGAGERLTLRKGMDPASSSATHALADVVRSNLGVIRTEFGRFGRQVSGYSLEHLLPERGFDVPNAFAGTEGTLGVLTEATVRLARAPRATLLVVLGYPDMASAGDAAPAIRRHWPKALEGLDSRIVDVVLRRRGPAFVPELPRGAGWLLAEIGAETPAEAADLAARVVADAGALDTRVVTEPGETAQLWRIREDGAGLASRPVGGRFFHAGWEDAAVPVERLGAYLRDFDALLVDTGLTGIPYGHFGEGCVHVRIDFPLGERGGVGVFRDFLLDGARLVASYGGSMSGEHGDGRARAELLPLMYSPDALAAFGAVKRAFDPEGLLNPGVLVDPAPMTADLRAVGARPVTRGLALAYHDDRGDFSNAVHRCTGVGKCRADITPSGGVMCPSYLATGNEKDTTRGRARVLQEMVNGTQVKGGWRSPEVHEVLDLCLQCKGCAVDCPTGVDMASYKAEVLHQSYRRRLRPRSHYSLGWLPRWARLASRAPRLTNALLGFGPAAALGKKIAGVDRRRPLPQFAEQTFREWFSGRPGALGDPVLLWVDTWTNHFTPQVGRAAVQVLEEAGFSVQIPEGTVCCGLTWISTGQLDAAKKQLRRSVDALAPAAAAGVPIVGLEPSCTAVFRGDAEELLGPDAPGVRSVASATRTLAELLTSREGWRAPDLSGVRGVAQPHCHQHAVMGFLADEELLRRGGSSVTSVGGCCGLAGNFGAEEGHYDVSVAVAETALLPAVRAAGEDAVVLTDGFSCRTQLSQLAGREGRHLAEVLAEAPRGLRLDDAMPRQSE
jgi:FAD/FMN-containing dehydrogenase/Fe-S oxidoreductase